MKQFLYILYCLATVFCISYGIPLMIININKNNQEFIIYMGLSIVGFTLLFFGAVVILLKKKHEKKE